MGFIRGTAVFFLGVLLLATLTLGNLFLILNLSLNYEKIQPKVVDFLYDFSQDNADFSESVGEEFEIAKSECQTKSVYLIEYGNGTIEIPCETIMKGQEETFKYGITHEFDKIYYGIYNCNPFECLSEGKYYYLISEEAKNYWKSKFYLFLAISLLIVFLMYFAFENKKNIFFVVGFVTVLSVLPFKGIEKILFFLDATALQFIPIILSEAGKVFLIMVSIGIFLIVLGILFRFFNLDEKIMEGLSSDERIKIKKN